MTVGELIQSLSRYDKNRKVEILYYVEGQFGTSKIMNVFIEPKPVVLDSNTVYLEGTED